MKRTWITTFLFVFLTTIFNITYCYGEEFNAERVYNSVFIITSGSSLGSGFAICSDLIITNAHVVEPNSDITVTTYTGDKYNAKIQAENEELDLAVLKVENADFVPVKTADMSTVKTGDDVYAIGAPNSMAYTLTKGVISAEDRKVGNHSFIQTDAAINTGNSGGPLLNTDEQVVGVNSYKLTNSEGIGLAIPINVVMNFMQKNGITINTAENESTAAGVNPEKTALAETTAENVTGNSSESIKNPFLEKLKSLNRASKILLCFLTISVILNIVLLILLILEKHKNIYIRTDPSERTDFEIDILE